MDRTVQIFSNVAGDGMAFFTKWCAGLRADGWKVQVVSAVSEQAYRRARTPWQRFCLRWRMYVAFGVRLAGACLKDPGAIRVVTTNPFYAPWLALLFPARSRVIMLLYDLWPDALEVGSNRPLTGWIRSLLEGITRQAVRRARAVVYLGDRLREYAETKYGPSRKALVLPVGADCAMFGEDPPAAMVGVTPSLDILYCGQMGAMHELAALQGLLAGPPPCDRCRFRFYASGSGYERLKALALHAAVAVQWEGPLPKEDWARAMKGAHIGLVTLRPGAERVAMPSKAYAAMAAGQALVAVAPADSDLADLVRRHDCGWVIGPGDSEGLRRALAEAAGNPDLLMRKRTNAHAAARRYYDAAVVSREWSALLREVSA